MCHDGFSSLTLKKKYMRYVCGNIIIFVLFLTSCTGVLSRRKTPGSLAGQDVSIELASVSVTNSSPTQSTTYNLSYGSADAYSEYCILENNRDEEDCSFVSGTLPAQYTVTGVNESKVLSVWIKNSDGVISECVDTNAVVLDTVAPILASATVGNSNPTNLAAYSLTYGAISGSYNRYCVLENDTAESNCSYITGSLPASKIVGTTNESKVLSIWLKDAAGNVSTRVDTAAVDFDNTAPSLASAAITNTSPTNSTTYNLSYGAVTGTYDRYCILKNNTTLSACSFVSGVLPASFVVDATNEAKVLSVWLKDAAGNVSARVDTNSVGLDSQAPVLASATISNSSPTNTQTYSITYGAVTGTYNRYCILENDTTEANCSYNVASLPNSFAVDGTEESKVLSVWIKDAAGNISTRVDTNSVTLDTTVPVLASVAISNSNPTNTPILNLVYGAVTGSYNRYCILENDIVEANCSYTTAALPATFSVDGTNEAKVLSVWIKDAAGNVSSRVDTGSIAFDDDEPVLASAAISNSSPTNSTTYSLTYGAVTGAYNRYCILENDSDETHCSYVTATLPASFVVDATNNAKVLSIWIKDLAGNISSRVSTNSVTLSTSAPVLASAAISNSSPTSSTTYGLTYGAITGTYDRYCILENDIVEAHCSYTTATLPASFVVDGTNNAKVLSIWIKDAAGNISGRVDTNSVTLSTGAPILASATVTNSSPTSTTTYSLSYGVVTGAYDRFCILENDTVESHCSYSSASLPASFVVDATEEAKVLSIWLKSASGVVSGRVDSNSVSLSTTAPSLASATVSNSSPTNSTTYNLTYGAVTNSYNRYCILENDTVEANCTYNVATLPNSFAVDGTNNAKVLSVWLKSASGVVSARVDTNSVSYDNDAPVLASAAVSNASPTTSTTFNLSFGAVTGTYSGYCILENDNNIGNCNFVAGTLPATFVVDGDNEAKVLSVWLRDAAGNSSARVDTNSVTLDDAAPSLASAAVTNSSPTVSTTFNLSYGAVTGSYNRYCILENDTVEANCSFVSASLPATFAVDGTNEAKVLSVWIKDAAGNVSARVDTNSVSLDDDAPVLASVAVSNSSPTSSTTYNLSYGAVTGTYNRYCILENDTTEANCSYVTATLPASFAVDATEEAKVLSVWLKDVAGNISSRVDTNSVTLDSSAPVLASAAVSNSSPTNSTTYNLTYGAVTGTYNRYCILENDTVEANCSYVVAALPASFAVDADEEAKVLSVWLKDAAGNISARVDTNSVTLDTTAPVLASAAVSNSSPTNSTTYNLTYGAVTGTYNRYCILENDTVEANCSYTTAALPVSYSVDTTEEAKVLSVWLKDSAGNISVRVDTNSVTLDTTAPILASAAVSNASPTTSTTYNLTYGAVTGTYNRYCLLENDTVEANCTYTTAALPASFTVDGTNEAKVLSIWLKDVAGNLSSRIDTNSVDLDDGAPALASVTVSNSLPTNSTSYGLSYGTVTGTYNRYCILENDSNEANCSYVTAALPASFTVNTTNEAKVLSVWLKDVAGNVSTRVDSNSVSFDNTAAVLASATVSNSSPTNSSTFNLTYGAITGSYNRYCILENDIDENNCSFITASLPASFVTDGVDGAKILSVWLKDSAGNVSARIDTNSVTLDGDSPVLASATVSNSNPTTSQTYNLSYGAITGTYDRYCILENDTTESNCVYNVASLPSSFAVDATNEAKVLSVWIKDAAGNVSARVDTISVTLDNEAPALASASVSNSSPTNSTTFNLTYGALTGTYNQHCILENDTDESHCGYVTAALPATFTVDADSESKVLSVWIKDAAGNISTRVDTVAVTYDDEEAVLASVTVSNSNPTNSTSYGLAYGSVTVNYNRFFILENDSDESHCSYVTAALPATFTVDGDNEAKVLSVWLKDTAGNISTRVDSNSVTFDDEASVLASAAISNASPTSSTTYNLTPTAPLPAPTTATVFWKTTPLKRTAVM
jgi:hypothetical protein